MYHLESHLAFAVRGADVRDVLVAGRVVVRNYRLVYLDADEIKGRAAKIGARIESAGPPIST
jgi:5-methylthioadenosine/S-adenosylhomocysteine deaminase